MPLKIFWLIRWLHFFHRLLLLLMAASLATTEGQKNHSTIIDAIAENKTSNLHATSNGIPDAGLLVIWNKEKKQWMQLTDSNDTMVALTHNPLSSRKVFQTGLCGNGLIDDGEDCDCGGPNNCSLLSKACCDPSYCIFALGAECAGGGCCTQDFQLKRNHEVCRAAKNSCDIPEVCAGKSSACPPDAFRRNGELCADGQGYCINRQCLTRDEQCTETWGLHSFSAVDDCYQQFNTKGVYNGHCGLAADNATLRPCAVKDVLCGTLQCRNGGYSPLSGTFEDSFTTTILTNSSGRLVQCKTKSPKLTTPFTIQVNLVQDWTKCGPQKICLKNRCISLATSVSMRPPACPSQNRSIPCSGRGICSDLNTCHCQQNFTGADCSITDLTQRIQFLKNNLMNLRRSTFNSSHYKKNQNEVVDNNTIQMVVIIMSVIILGAMVGIMSSACCGRRARWLQTHSKNVYNDQDESIRDEMV